MNALKIFIIIIPLYFLYTCSSQNGDIEDFMKCGMAAQQLGKREAENVISKKMRDYFIKNKVLSSDRKLMELAQEVRDDLNLNVPRSSYTTLKLAKAYNSSTCQDMHEQGIAEFEMSFLNYIKYLLMW